MAMLTGFVTLFSHCIKDERQMNEAFQFGSDTRAYNWCQAWQLSSKSNEKEREK
jgi:hypothetical protein